MNLVGIPYVDHGQDLAGADCYGLARIFYAREFHIELPDFRSAYRSADDKGAVEVLLRVGSLTWKRVTEFRKGDLHLMRFGAHACHIGIALNETDFLHTIRGRNSSCERLDSWLWDKSRVATYRHKDLT